MLSTSTSPLWKPDEQSDAAEREWRYDFSLLRDHLRYFRLLITTVSLHAMRSITIASIVRHGGLSTSTLGRNVRTAWTGLPRDR
jgi:hypothetical protein